MANLKRIIIGQSGGPTPVIDMEVAGALQAAQEKDLEVYGAMNGLEGILHADVKGNIVDLTDVNPMQFYHNGPGSGLKTTRLKPNEDQYNKMAENLDELGIDGIVYIGGNDSADQLLGLTEINPDLAAIHAIKTIDNDLPKTHHSPGWGSASLFNAIALKNVTNDFFGYGVRSRIGSEESLLIAPIVIYQVMGRKAGWLAQATSFARVDPKGEIVEGNPPNIILCREVPFDKDEYLGDLEDAIRKYGHASVVVQEDLTDKATGKSLSELYGKDTKDAHGHIDHGRATSFSTTIYIAQITKEELKMDNVKKVKDLVLVPQHLQRSFMISQTDATEAYMVGCAAVKALLDGKSKKSVILKKEGHGNFTTDLTDLSDIAGEVRQVPLNYINGISGTTQEFVDEYIHVIGGATAVPQYSHIKFKPVLLR